jgi:hypothetical protein
VRNGGVSRAAAPLVLYRDLDRRAGLEIGDWTTAAEIDRQAEAAGDAAARDALLRAADALRRSAREHRAAGQILREQLKAGGWLPAPAFTELPAVVVADDEKEDAGPLALAARRIARGPS